MMKRLFAAILCAAMVFTLAGTAFADGTGDQKGYLVLGEDLNSEEKEKVLHFLEIEDTSDYTVSYTTNEQEHEAFDSYLSSSVIGSRALSSILMVPREKGKGISVSSYNITYCTVEMYQNALISAGVQDVAVYIAAPYPVSGTCALVSAMNAYSTLSGSSINAASADAAVDELVTTGVIGDALGSNDDAAKLFALLKQQVVQQKLSNEELGGAVDAACDQLGLKLTSDLKKEIVDVLVKVKETDIDPDTLATQAKDLYNKVSGSLKELGITREEAVGFLGKLVRWVVDFINAVLGTGKG